MLRIGLCIQKRCKYRACVGFRVSGPCISFKASVSLGRFKAGLLVSTCPIYVVKIQLQCKTSYKLMGREAKSTGGFDNQINSTGGQTVNVTVCEVVPCPALTASNYKCFKHGLTSLGPEYLHQIGGVKLYTRGREPGKEAEIKLKNGQAKQGAIEPLYYNKCMGDIYVYFYGSDPRPLLLCYNKEAYCAKTMQGYDKQEWYKEDEAGECKCTQAPGTCEKCKLLTELVRVSDFLNPVDIKLVPMSGQYCKWYSIHTFNGRKIWIRVSSQFACGSFCFDRFTHTHYGTGRGGTGFRLGDIYHGKNCIKLNGVSEKNGNNGKCISASDIDNKDNKHRASSEVVVFYYKGDTKHEHPLLVAMRKPGSCIYYSPYFELQKKFDQGQPKLYKKNDNGKDLKLGDTSPDGELAKTLDAILYRISKYLRVVLSQRPVPRDYKASSDKNGHITDVFKAKGEKTPSDKDPGKQLFDVNVKMLEKMAESADEASKSGKPSYTTRDALMHHVLRETSYKGQLLNGQPETPPSSPPTETTITVTEVDCTEIHSIGGYRCFKHDLVNTEHIEQVGGLKLAVFEGQGTPSAQEITLCTGGTNGTTNGKIDIEYTTCKGDLYVFFYGDDPRPMMLCYDGHAYRPTSLETYCRQWVRVNNGANGAKNGQGTPVDCLCQDAGGGGQKPKFNSQQLLNALYRVSVFMNPVKLCLTQQAIEAMKHKREGQSDQPSKPAKPLEFLYSIDKNPPQCIQVRIVPQDLNCYRCYTHKTAKEGFRLGEVTYAEAKGDGDAGAKATGSQCADAVSTASTTTTTACSASGTPTTTSNNEPFCFEYDCSKQLWSVCVYYYMYDKDHKWPLVVELGFRGEPSLYYRLCSKPDSGTNGDNGGNGECSSSKLPSGGLRWVRMAGKGGNGSVQNGQGDPCQPCNTGADTQTDTQSPEDKQEQCKKDAEFVEEATRLYRLAHGWDREVGAEFKAHESDLNDLIEGRAYEIRNQLGIEYGEKTKERLILATDKNCHEDSIMGYVVGGGVLGVAGGGGWKIAVAVLGLVVKL